MIEPVGHRMMDAVFDYIFHWKIAKGIYIDIFFAL